MTDDPYSQEIASAGVAIKRGTPDVPADRRYHLLHDGEVKGSYRGLKAATVAYRQLLADIGWKPPEKARQELNIAKLQEERFFDEYEAYWSRSAGHRSKGGRVNR
jgi:hypothetical protein